MTRTRRADSADPAHETVDSTKQLKDTKRHLPGKSKLPRAKKSGRIPEEDHDHLLAKTKKYAPPPAHHASGVHVETSKDPKHDIVPPKMRASTSATQLVQPNRTAKAIAAATATRTPGLALPVVPGSLGTRVKGPDTSIGGALSRGA
jgi:hypothetical protein